ncbi:hypothetical protein HMPREF0493_1338 [Lactobacillus amylolyticus DSM 11664]|uniref:Uncharacterized protein n=1 Tax=Lactobacillus amylolyticus DSM 11664 TaxID=585524 RepID=D4YUX7_9LACO|nr:hypothetical protein HMPREF0493_1338 [Lactobacillus amylolyticus DSM 11664]
MDFSQIYYRPSGEYFLINKRDKNNTRISRALKAKPLVRKQAVFNMN